jgi:hypothetical protein
MRTASHAAVTTPAIVAWTPEDRNANHNAVPAEEETEVDVQKPVVGRDERTVGNGYRDNRRCQQDDRRSQGAAAAEAVRA